MCVLTIIPIERYSHNIPNGRYTKWLEFERPTIADVAVFSYVAMAGDGKINLDAYTHVLQWIERVKQLPGYLPRAGI
jgi:glutathione S-transferase